jgi:hypothetical protein
MWWNSAASKPANDNPNFYVDAQHPFNVYNDFNHNSALTRNLTERFIEYWLTEYKLDGFRWDLSKGFTNQNCLGNQACWDAFNQDRINIWQNYYNKMQAVSGGSYCILEHLSADSEEYELAAYDRHSLNYDNVALGRLPTSVTSDPAVFALKELAYLPQGVMDPHGVSPTAPRAGRLPTQVIAAEASEPS